VKWDEIKFYVIVRLDYLLGVSFMGTKCLPIVSVETN
jgi:hypothetical protein